MTEEFKKQIETEARQAVTELLAQAKLKKGDICGFANKPHTMVYAGKSKHGYPLWYSAGGSDVKAKNYGPKRKKSYEKRKIYVRIRLK